MRATKSMPYCAIAGRAPSITFHVIRTTRSVAAAAAAPATTCNVRSPKRNRRPVNGRRVPSGVTSAEDSVVLGAVDLRDRLLGDDQDRPRDRLEEQLRPEGLAL